MSKKFYRVFVSSTYEDLKEERQAVFDALLKCNCFPVGMEHFPSSNWRSLDLIKKYIDQCDYYVVISAGMYGSIIPEQKPEIGYVEWEYDYANSRLPCYSFIVEDIGKLTSDKVDKQKWRKLDAFHEKLKRSGRNAAFYTSAENLNARVLHAFQHAPRDSPAIGWIRSDSVSPSEALIGAWKLVSSNVPEWGSCSVYKIFSAKEFMWIRADDAGNTDFILGHYSRNTYYGTVIIEHPRETSFSEIKGARQQYSIYVDGDKFKTYGERSTGQYIEEEFHRLDLSGTKAPSL